MAITDYDRKKKLESSDFNDASSTIDKAQPIILAGNDYTGVDGFEGGTSQIGFASTGSVYFNGNGEVYGDDSLQFECSSLTSFTASESKSLQSSVSTDGKKVLFSLKFDTQTSDSDDELAFDLLNSSGNTVVTIEFRHDGTVHALNDTNFNQISSWSAGTIYDVEVVMDFTNFQFDVIINGTTEATDFGHAIDSSSVDQISIFHDTSTSGVSTNAFVDRLTYTNASEDSINAGGWIGYDSSIVADAQDFAWYDGNGNLIDYEIENGGDLGSASNKVTVWGYGSRTRDNTVQDQIAYGNNSANTDRSVAKSTVYGNDSNAFSGYDFETTSGQLIDFISSNDSTATAVTNKNVSGQFSNAWDFDGTDDHTDMDETAYNLESVGSENSYYISAWVKPESLSSRADFIRFDSTSTRPRFFWYVGKNGDAQVEIDINLNGFVTLSSSVGDISTNEWQHFALRSDGSTVYLYVNGTQVDSASYGEATLDGGDAVSFGSSDGTTRPLDGQLDQFEMYSDGKSAAYAQAEYDASPKGGQVFFTQQAAETTSTSTEKSTTASVDTVIKSLDKTTTSSIDTVIQSVDNTTTAAVDTVIATRETVTSNFDAALKKLDRTTTASFDATIEDTGDKVTATFDTVIKSLDNTTTAAFDTVISGGDQTLATFDTVIQSVDNQVTANFDATLLEQFEETATFDAVLKGQNQVTASIDTAIQSVDNTVQASIDASIKGQSQVTATFDAALKEFDKTVTATVDTIISTAAPVRDNSFVTKIKKSQDKTVSGDIDK